MVTCEFVALIKVKQPFVALVRFVKTLVSLTRLKQDSGCLLPIEMRREFSNFRTFLKLLVGQLVVSLLTC